ncbi:hypothetical protein [Gilliamella sp. Gris1-4]|uniref:hypothetical protein n=1 Tax=Gilliamella sp. Gris1-4 TaxID=3120244 RepID=UPI00114794BA|nr:hypothetical protein [Gilliamella apicola]
MAVFTVNACTPFVYGNNSNGAKTNIDLNNNGGLDNHLNVGDNFTEDAANDGVDFATRNDFGDENNCGACF